MADNVRRLSPRSAPPPGPVGLICKRPDCAEPVERDDGRPSLFCSKPCQLKYQRQRVEVRRRLKDAQRLADQYEITADGRSSAQHRETAARSDAPERTSAIDDDLLVRLLHAVRVTLATAQSEMSPADRIEAMIDELSAAEEAAYAALVDRRRR